MKDMICLECRFKFDSDEALWVEAADGYIAVCPNCESSEIIDLED